MLGGDGVNAIGRRRDAPVLRSRRQEMNETDNDGRDQAPVACHRIHQNSAVPSGQPVIIRMLYGAHRRMAKRVGVNGKDIFEWL
jgi:hypothetical protein